MKTKIIIIVSALCILGIISAQAGDHKSEVGASKADWDSLEAGLREQLAAALAKGDTSKTATLSTALADIGKSRFLLAQAKSTEALAPAVKEIGQVLHAAVVVGKTLAVANATEIFQVEGQEVDAAAARKMRELLSATTPEQTEMRAEAFGMELAGYFIGRAAAEKVLSAAWWSANGSGKDTESAKKAATPEALRAAQAALQAFRNSTTTAAVEVATEEK